MRSSRRLNVHKVNNYRDSFSLELRSNCRTEEELKRLAITQEQSQEDDGACAQQYRFEHEHQCKNTEEEYPAQRETDEESETNTLLG